MLPLQYNFTYILLLLIILTCIYISKFTRELNRKYYEKVERINMFFHNISIKTRGIFL